MTIETPKVTEQPVLFPRIHRGTKEAMPGAVEEVAILPAEIQGFCSDNAIEVAVFFQTIWSLLIHQFVDSDHWGFGFQDLIDHNSELPADAIQIIELSLCPETNIPDLIQSLQVRGRPHLGRAMVPEHSTALILVQKTAEWNPITWLEKHRGRKDDYYEAVLIVEFENGAPKVMQLVYNLFHFTTQHAVNVASTITQGMERVMAHPNQRVGDLDLFSPQNMDTVSKWNRYDGKSVSPSSVVEYISQHAGKRPDAPAICAWDGELTYAQLDCLVSRLAIHLRGLGVKSQILVPLTVERSMLAIVVELAILRAGGAFVPVDPLQPLERLQSIIEQTGATVAVASEKFQDRLKGLVGSVVIISQDVLTSLPEESSAIIPPVAADSTAYMLFTSGSTGQPKGCVVENAALADVFPHAAALKMEPQSRVLQFASYSFGVSLIEIFCTMTMGATICIPSEEDRLNRLNEVITEMGVSWAFLTPTTAGSLDPTMCEGTLKTLVLAGEPMRTQHFRTWAERLDLYQGFGFTEWAGVCCVSPVIRTETDIHTIGTSPTANLWLVQPTDHNRLATVGSVAELLVEGPSLASGYLNDEAKTSSAFLVNPPWLRNRPGMHRVYKTGDLVQYQPDGTLRYITRKDTQVKIRGKRLELGEVEHQLRLACPYVDKVVAEAASPLDGDEVPLVAAFLQSAEYSDSLSNKTNNSALATQGTAKFRSDVTEIRRILEITLPDYMRPSVYLPLQYLGLTISGKVDRRSLRKLLGSLTREELEAYQSSKAVLVAPTNSLEQKLHGIYSQVLKLDPQTFGVHDSFIQLGGDSVLAMRVVSQSRKQDCSLSVASILDLQTISKLVAHIQERQDRTKTDINEKTKEVPSPGVTNDGGDLDKRLSMLGISPQEVVDVYPCSPIQEGMLLSQIRNPQQYQMRFTWKISPSSETQPVDVERLQGAWLKVCQRHDLLRSRFFESVSGKEYAIQVVLKDNIKHPKIVQDPDLDPDTLLDHPAARDHLGDMLSPQITFFHDTRGKVYAVLSISHMRIDASSMAIITQDLSSFYEGNGLEAQTCSYRKYVEYLSTLNKEAALGFWKSNLAGLSPSLFPHLNSAQNQGTEYHRLGITLENLRKYREFCQKQGITLANVFKIAWGLVLRCFTGNDDVCFGYMTAGRDVPIDGADRSVGPFVNMLICRIQFNQGKSLLHALQRVQTEFIQAIEHQNASLAEVRHCLGIADETLFNTAMTFPPQSVQGDGTNCSHITVSEVDRWDPTEFDILVEVEPRESDIQCGIKYWSDLLSHDQAQQLSRTLKLALTHIMELSDVEPSNVDLFHDGDMSQLAGWNNREPEQTESCIHDLIQQQCQAQPDALAVEAWDGCWTYGELDELSSGLAQHLQSLGIGPEDFVPLCFTKCRWVPIALMAVIKTGAAFCLLDLSHPISRLQEICRQLNSSVVLTSPQEKDLAQKLNVKVVVVGDLITTPSKSSVSVEVSPTNALYAVFTSGSTGTPKGIVIEHRSLVSSTQAAEYVSHLTKEDRVLQFSSYAFDVSIFDHLATFQSGACLCIPSEEDRQNNLVQAVKNFRVTWAHVTPSVSRLLDPSQLPNLRTLLLIGEPMIASDIETWASHVRLINMYGPAECAVVATSHQCTDITLDTGVIGMALRNFATWVVDPSDYKRLMPIGAIGELILEGEGVGRGYIGEDVNEVTPFLETPQWLSRFRKPDSCRKLYRTGDLVRYTPEGRLRYLGRKDTQVKIRGQRVELSEIESGICTFFGGAADAVVEVMKMGHAGVTTSVVAFVHSPSTEGRDGFSEDDTLFARPTEAFQSLTMDIATWLHARLPKYMVPSVYIPLIHMPMAASGKADRKLLRRTLGNLSAPDIHGFSRAQGGCRPTETAMEVQLQGLFALVFRMPQDQIWADNNFFLLGGDSLMAMSLVTAAREAGFSLSVADIFKNPQLSTLAMVMQPLDLYARKEIAAFSLLDNGDTELVKKMAAEQCQISGEQVEDVYPCTPLQEGLISMSALKAGMYTAQLVYEVPPETDILRLKTSWQETILANEILRTRIVSLPDQGLCQVVAGAEASEVEWFQGDCLKHYLQEDAGKIMEIGQPLVRSGMVYEEDRAHFVLALHHAIYDAFSLPLLLQQIESAYQGNPLQSRKFNHFVQYIQCQNSDEVTRFWASEFNNLGAAVFPPLHAAVQLPVASAHIEKKIQVNFDGSGGVTLSNMIRLAWAIILGQYTDNSDIVFGVTVSGRNAAVADIEQLPGPTIATVPFRVLLDQKMSISSAVSSVQQHATRMIPFEQTGLQNICNMSPEASAACNFQSHLGVQFAGDMGGDSSIMTSRTDFSDYAAFTNYALVLVCHLPGKTGGEVNVSANFDPRLLPQEEAEPMLSQFCHVLQQICKHPGRRVGEIELVTPADMEMLRQWNGELCQSSPKTVHDVVLAHAHSRPHDLAVSSWDRDLTFQELDILSFDLSQQLRQIGIKPGDCVPLCFEKSTWPVVAMLAVLRAGGVCVNVDPALPAARIQHMLQDTKPGVILASPEKQELMVRSATSFTTMVQVVPSGTLPSIPDPVASVEVQSHDPAFIVFTSGSTGVPKGIVMEHDDLMTSIEHHSGFLGVQPTSRALQFAAYAFDASLYETFTPLVTGASVFIPSEETRMSDLAGYIREHDIDWALLTPSATGIISPADVPSIRTLVTGGEALTSEIVHIWASKVRLINAYGPAETTICAAGDVPAQGWRPGTIGPILGGSGWITMPSDPSRLAPVGAVGELLIEGPVVTRGYINRPEKTSEVYLEPPTWLQRFRNGKPGRVYRSGDLAQFTVDGWIRFFGRKDTQTKLRGQRIELGEIETHVRRALPDATEVVAEVCKRTVAGHISAILVVFVYWNTELDHCSVIAQPSKPFLDHARDVQKQLRGSLPSYMVPAAVLPLSYVPRTSSGKIDRRCLREVISGMPVEELEAHSGGKEDSEWKEPVATKDEEAMQKLWAQVLGLSKERIGRGDSFFQLGGESIAAMKLAGAARIDGFGLTVQQIFDKPCLSDMAALMHGDESKPSRDIARPAPLALLGDKDSQAVLLQVAAKSCGISPEQIEDIYPCTPLQEGLITLSARDPKLFVSTGLYTLPEGIDLARLQYAWDKAFQAHPILRTRIIQTESQETLQIVIRETPVLEPCGMGEGRDPNALNVQVALGKPLLRLSIVSSPHRLQCVISMHHSIYDGWSLPLLLREVERAYHGEILQSKPFSPFIAYLQDSHDAALEFWRTELSGVEVQMFPNLPSVDHIPQPNALAKHTVALSPGTADQQITMATKMKFSWALLISRYTGSRDVVYGVTTNGRGSPVPDIETQIGPTIATCPTRVSVELEGDVFLALRQLQQGSLEQMRYEHVGLQHISRLGPSHAAACAFQTLMVIQGGQAEHQSDLLKQEDTPARLENFSTYSIMLYLVVTSTGVDIDVVFDDRVVSPVQMRRLLCQFDHILSQVYTATGNISQLSCISEEDRKELDCWNKIPDNPEMNDPCLHDLVQEQCQIHPESQAVCSWDGNYTYRELDEHSSCFAAFLQAQGVCNNKLVPVLAVRSRLALLCQLAILRAGGAFVMLNPSHPQERNMQICAEVEAMMVLTSTDLAPTAKKFCSQVVILSNDVRRQFSEFATTTVRSETTIRSAAYAGFTSGSTGKPKGFVIEHRSACVSLTNSMVLTNVGPQTRLLQFAGLGFDISVADHFLPLIAGGCVCIPSDYDRDNQLAKSITDLQVNWMCLTSSVMRLIQPLDVPCVRTVIQCGEAMTGDIVDTWASHTQLINAYGPAECAMFCCIQTEVTPLSDASNIGYSNGGALWVIDPQDPECLLPIGAVGELVVEGPQVGRGYLNDPLNTAKAFINPPSWISQFSDRSNRDIALYRTGDLVRYTPNGSLRCLGRQDSQVKLRGQRIELLAVEHHIRQCFSGTQDTVVGLLRVQDGHVDMLVAFVVLDGTYSSSDHDYFLPSSEEFLQRVEQAKNQLQDHVPEYMVPAVFIPLRQMPRNHSGKADRNRLVAMAAALPRDTLQAYRSTATAKALPSTELERQVLGISASVLHIPPKDIGVKDSFFALGGDSISSMQLALRCKEIGLDVTVADIFKLKNISALAAQSRLEVPAVRKIEEITTWTELSPIQQLFFETNPDEHNHFNQSITLRIIRSFSAIDIQNAIRTLVQTHSMLRARFRRSSTGSWSQIVTDDIENSIRFEEHNINSKQAMTKIIAQAHKSLDIQHGPLFSVTLFRDTDSKKDHLTLVIHHLVVDIVSWSIIQADLEVILRTKRVLELSTPFLAWNLEQAEYAGRKLKPEVALPVELPKMWPIMDYWGASGCSNSMADTVVHEFLLGNKETQAIMGTANAAFRTKPVEIIQASLLYAFVQCFSDRPPPIFWSEGHGRESWDDSFDLTRTVGWFTTIWPTCVDLDSTEMIEDAIQRTKDSRRQVPANGWAYFASSYLNKQGREAFKKEAPMEICFNYSGRMQQAEGPDSLLVLREIGTEGVVGSSMQRFALIDISAMVDSDGLRVNFSINRHLQPQTTLTRWVNECQRCLNEIAAHLPSMQPMYTQSDFPLVSLGNDQLASLNGEVAAKYGAIEDISPLTPVQRGILLSQLRNPKNYLNRVTLQISPTDGYPAIDTNALRKAWLRVVAHHAALRTIRAPWLEQAAMDQILLRDYQPRVAIHTQDVIENLLDKPEYHGNPVEDDNEALSVKAAIYCDVKGRVFLDIKFSHVFLDGSSLPIIWRDLNLAYEDKLPTEGVPSLTRIFSDIAQAPSAAAKEYWGEYVKNAEPCIVPTMRPGDGDEGHDHVEIELFHSTAAIDSFCAHRNITLTTLMHVAWALVLRCYTSTDQVCFGYPTSGREQPIEGIQNAVGLFMNMLLARIDLPGHSTLESILSNYQLHFAEHLAHQNCSLAEMGLPVTGVDSALFNTLITVRRDSSTPTSQLPMSMRVLSFQEPTEYPLEAGVTIVAQKVNFSVVYHHAFASQQQATTVGLVFRDALATIIQDPTQKVGQVPLIPHENIAQITRWNQQQTPCESRQLVHSVIDARTVDHPDAPAVCAWDGTMTYQEMDHHSCILAERLRDLGVGPEVFVPLCLEKTLWVPIAALAVLKAGGAFVLLDPSLPQSRLQAICEDVNAKVIIASSTTSKLAMALATNVVELTAGLDLWSRSPSKGYQYPNNPTGVNHSNAAYVFFTSGSTGKPKGAIIEHGAFCASHNTRDTACKIPPGSRVLAFVSHAFDIAVDDILSTLMAGGCLCIPSDADRVSRLAEAASEMRVTRANVTPSVARLFTPAEVPTLTNLLMIGESPQRVEINTWSTVELTLAYGPAECGPWTIDLVAQHPVQDPTNLGRPISNVMPWVVDQRDHSRLVPVGAVGELVFEGPTLSRGYLNQVAKTKASFIDAPAWRSRFSFPSPWRFYKTGDLVQYQPDGTLRFLGRRDTQVKLRGQRIELGEVEFHAQRAFPHAQQVISDIINPVDGHRPPFLAAFVLQPKGDADQGPESGLFGCPSPQFQSDIQVANLQLQRALPSSMIPTIFLPLLQLPMTSTGKTDRLALRREASKLARATLKAQSVAEITYRMPSTPIEKELTSLSAEVLGMLEDRLGIDANLFENGLDSLGAMRLASLARTKTLQLTIANIFAYPRIAELALLVKRIDYRKQEVVSTQPGYLLKTTPSYEELITHLSSMHPFSTGNVVDILPTTEIQRMYFRSLQQVYFTFAIPGCIDPSRMRAAISAVVHKYDALRTVFVPFEETVLQVVLRQVDCPVIEESIDNADDILIAAWSKSKQDALSPVPAGAPIPQLTLLSTMDRSCCALTLRLSHVQYDGFCLPLIFQELSRAYMEPSLEQTARSFSDFLAQRVKHNISPTVFQFWTDLLQGSSHSQLDVSAHVDHPQPEVIIQPTRTISLPQVPSGITIATVHKAAWSLTLARRTQSRDLMFGQVVNGRSLPLDGIQDIVGPCLNIIPVRVPLQPEWTIQDLLRHVHQQHAKSIEYETVDMEDIVAQCTSWPKGTSFGSITQHQNLPTSRDAFFAGHPARYAVNEFNYLPQVPHIVSTPRDENRIEMLLWASTRSLTAEAAEGLLEEFCSLFVDMLAGPERLIEGFL